MHMHTDEKYMRRALGLAANGYGGASPNPMVGAVIVAADGRVIGEGWHRLRGEGHAEVNAVASVPDADRGLLSESTMYVTLEPCSHYGKTPPCAELIVRTGIPRVVVATVDPNPRVAGRGIAILREAGVEVEVGMLGHEARELNRRFFTSQILRRPWITLKWACSADGFMDCERSPAHPEPYLFSTPVTSLATMKLRSHHDAVLTTANTALADNCRLTVREWYGRQPLRLLIDNSGRVPASSLLFQPVTDVEGTLSADSRAEADVRGLAPAVRLPIPEDGSLETLFSELYTREGISSVLVEAGPTFLGRLIELGLWDAARVELAPVRLGECGRAKAPAISYNLLVSDTEVGPNRLMWFLKPADWVSSGALNGCEKN